MENLVKFKNGKKIRIPRKMKKERYIEKHIKNVRCSNHKSTPKLKRYYYYLDVQYGIKEYNMTPSELYNSFGFMLVDHIVWWNWVRWKHIGIEPQNQMDYPNIEMYFDYFNECMKNNNIKI